MTLSPEGASDTYLDIDGACLCGQVRYEARIDRRMVRLCHCTQCQIQSASAFRTAVLVERENFRLLTGQLKVYVKTAESGVQRALTFCPDCGTSLYGCAVTDPKMYSLRLGTARQRAELAPVLQMWSRSAMPWLQDLGAIPSHEKGATPAAALLHGQAPAAAP